MTPDDVTTINNLSNTITQQAGVVTQLGKLVQFLQANPNTTFQISISGFSPVVCGQFGAVTLTNLLANYTASLEANQATFDGMVISGLAEATTTISVEISPTKVVKYE